MKRTCLILAHVSVYATLWMLTQHDAPEWGAMMVASLLIWISAHDIETLEIPDSATLLLIVVAIALLFELPHSARLDKIVGAIVWPLAFWSAAFYFRWRSGHDGLGFGDVKLMVPLALLCGFTGAIYLVLGASISGILMLSLQFIRDGKAKVQLQARALAFAPFLCFWGWALWLWL